MSAEDPASAKVSFVTPIKAEVRLSLLLTWAQNLSIAALILLIGVGMDRVLVGEPIGWVLPALMLGALACRAFAAAAVPRMVWAAEGRLENWGREKLYRHIVRLGAPLRSTGRTGTLVSAGSEGVELASTYYATFLGPIIASMSVPVLVVATIAIFLDPWSALWLFVAIPIIPGMVGGLQSTFQAVSDGYRDTAASLSARFLDALQGLPTLKLHNQGKAHGEVIARETESLRRAIMRLLAGNQIVLLVVDALFALAMITLAATLAMIRLRAGVLTPGEAIALVLFGLLLIEPLDKVGQFFYIGMSGMASAKEVRAVLAEEPEVGDSAETIPSASDGSIELRDVKFSYPTGDEVLRGLSLRIAPRSTVALVGPSGVGKTTVANLLQRNLAPTEGTIFVGGHNISEVASQWVRDQLTVVSQSTYLFTGTLRSNLLIAKPEASDAELWHALEQASLADFVRGLAEQLDTPVGERGMSLSGGEAQRVAIARAWLKDAPIVVLDEPTSNVDLESEAAIVEAMQRLTRDRTVLVIAHRLTTIRDVDQIVVLSDGRVIEAGTHTELSQSGGQYASTIAVSNDTSSADAPGSGVVRLGQRGDRTQP